MCRSIDDRPRTTPVPDSCQSYARRPATYHGPAFSRRPLLASARRTLIASSLILFCFLSPSLLLAPRMHGINGSRRKSNHVFRSIINRGRKIGRSQRGPVPCWLLWKVKKGSGCLCGCFRLPICAVTCSNPLLPPDNDTH